MSILIEDYNDSRINAELIQTIKCSITVVKLALNNPIRVQGLIRNLAKTDLYIRYGRQKDLHAAPPYICIPANGGNMDLPELFTGEIYGIWEHLDPLGYAAIHHFYLEK